MYRGRPCRDPVGPSMPRQDGIGDKSANPLWLLVLLCGRGLLVHFAFTCVLEYLHTCSMVCAG